ncbi:MAG TPA: NUDIX domain-containing protein [Bacteroidales bacterium]|nr:NUDIX domain-containing protein [Bacteroidales bacterium]
MKSYSKFPKYLVAVDCIVFGYDIQKKILKLLLVKRSFEPSKGSWSLPGGFVKSKESLDEAAGRILRKLTGIGTVYLMQSYTYGETDRDPGARVISTSYYALIGIREIDQKVVKDSGAHWRDIDDLPKLIFDHPRMIKRALADLQNLIKVKPVGFELLPEKFTLVQLQELYEAIFQRKVDKRNFRKKILSMGILEKLEEKEKVTSKKGAWYYMFNKEQYDNLSMNGFSYNLDVS